MAMGRKYHPAKHLSYLLLKRDSRLSEGMEIGVDFGCKGMGNRRVFKTKFYYGVDLDADALAKGKAKNPGAIIIHSPIEKAKVPPADFAICRDVIGGTNFQNSKAPDVVRALVERVAPGGTLLVTVKQKNDRPEYIHECVSELKDAFDKVSIVGLDFRGKKRSKLASLTLAATRYVWKTNPDNQRRIYCRCIGRRSA